MMFIVYPEKAEPCKYEGLRRSSQEEKDSLLGLARQQGLANPEECPLWIGTVLYSVPNSRCLITCK